MLINLISDIHGHLPEVSDADLTLIAGDLCPLVDHAVDRQLRWLDSEFRSWLDGISGEKIGICGNHDFVGETKEGWQLLKNLPWTYLENESVEAIGSGLKVFGSPYSNNFGPWAFMTDEESLMKISYTIPRDTDIILFHGPPYGYGDLIPAMIWSVDKNGWDGSENGDRVGCRALANQLTYDEWPNLKLLVTGHIHESRGFYSLKDFVIANAAFLDGRMKPYPDGILQFDIGR